MSDQQQPSASVDGLATRWTISGGWRDGDKHFTAVTVDPATILPEVAVQWVEEDGLAPCLLVAAWDYTEAMRTHARLWQERRDAERVPLPPIRPSATPRRRGRRW